MEAGRWAPRGRRRCRQLAVSAASRPLQPLARGHSAQSLPTLRAGDSSETLHREYAASENRKDDGKIKVNSCRLGY